MQPPRLFFLLSDKSISSLHLAFSFVVADQGAGARVCKPLTDYTKHKQQ